MSRLKRPALALEALEDRATPAIFGQPWPDGRHVTLSFAGDGTPISGVPSSLGSIFSSLGTDTAKLQMLKAFQSWTVWANLNVGLVGDSNLAFGTPGAVEGDPRFGDIRIGARPLAGDVITITAPFSLLTPNSGDIIVNSTKSFIVGGGIGSYDPFTVFMQESGHSFGMSNSTDPASVMYEQYGIARAGLSAGDIANIQSLYGARTPDLFEGMTGNETIDTATPYTGPLEADLTTTNDVDTYSYTADSADGRWFRINAAGLSLVTAKLDVLDATGQVVGSAQADSPLQNDVSVYVPELVPGATYYLRVSSARSDVFGVGAYRLAVDSGASGGDQSDPNALVDNEAGANDTMATATAATVSAGPYAYSFRSSLSSASDVDFFSIHAPSSPTGFTKLTINVSGVGGASIRPTVQVFTTSGSLLPVHTVVDADSSVVVSLDSLAANTDYVIEVANAGAGSGNYDFVAAFSSAGAPAMMGAMGTLNGMYGSTSATLNIYQSQTIQVNQVASVQGETDTISRVRVYDAQNQVVFELYSLSGQDETAQVFLARGTYRIEVTNLTMTNFSFSLTVFGVSDPIGSKSTDPTLDPSGDPTSTGNPPPPPPDPNTTVKITPPPMPPPTVSWF
jgi:hypothetical protein